MTQRSGKSFGETEKLGLPKRRIRFDAYGQYKLTDRDREFTNRYQGKTFELTIVTADGVSQKIPARFDEPILVALERAGIRAPSKCRNGECGWCRSRLVAGEVYTPETTERRRQYDRVAGYIHPCCSFSVQTAQSRSTAKSLNNSVDQEKHKKRVPKRTF